MYTVGSGLLIAAFALAALINVVIRPGNIIYLVLLEMLPKRELICWAMIDY